MEESVVELTTLIVKTDAESLFNSYFKDFIVEEHNSELSKFLTSLKVDSILILKNIYIEPSHRAKGLGKESLLSLVKSSSLPIVLICDNLETQRQGFNLEDWYLKNRFEHTGFNTISGPILIRIL